MNTCSQCFLSEVSWCLVPFSWLRSVCIFFLRSRITHTRMHLEKVRILTQAGRVTGHVTSLCRGRHFFQIVCQTMCLCVFAFNCKDRHQLTLIYPYLKPSVVNTTSFIFVTSFIYKPGQNLKETPAGRLENETQLRGKRKKITAEKKKPQS